nr:hypothetical protein [Streptococcus vicugnae]
MAKGGGNFRDDTVSCFTSVDDVKELKNCFCST